MEFDRSRIKEKAKAILHQAYPRPWKVTLVFQLLFFALPLALLFSFTLLIQILFLSSPAERLAQELVSSGAMAIMVFVLLFYLALLILMMLFGAGYHCYCLRLWRREPSSYRDLFRGSCQFNEPDKGIQQVRLHFLERRPPEKTGFCCGGRYPGSQTRNKPGIQIQREGQVRFFFTGFHDAA